MKLPRKTALFAWNALEIAGRMPLAINNTGSRRTACQADWRILAGGLICMKTSAQYPKEDENNMDAGD